MPKALFLDRDGVLNRELGKYVTKAAELEVLPWIPEELLKWQERGYLLIVITNQGGVAKGLYSHEELARIHGKLQLTLEAQGVFLTDIFYCPHHPDYDTACICRKPDSQMLEKALVLYNLDKEDCFYVGDSDRDFDAGGKAGIRTFQVRSNHRWNLDELIASQ